MTDYTECETSSPPRNFDLRAWPPPAEDAISRLQPGFHVVQRRRSDSRNHLLSLLLPASIYHGSSRCAQAAASAAAGAMSAPTNPEVKELSPVDFIQLQQYIECEYRQGGGRVGLLSQRLTPPSPPPPSPLPFPPTHTVSTAGCSLPQSLSEACASFVFWWFWSDVVSQRL